MNYQTILKYIWIFLSCFAILGLVSMIPFDKYQNKYLNKRERFKTVPQQHIDATERYVEAIEDGLEDTSKGILGRAPKKYYLPRFKNSQPKPKTKTINSRKYNKPLYKRDKNNPNILYKYKK